MTELQRNVNFKTLAYVPFNYVNTLIHTYSISFMLPTGNTSVIYTRKTKDPPKAPFIFDA